MVPGEGRLREAKGGEKETERLPEQRSESSFESESELVARFPRVEEVLDRNEAEEKLKFEEKDDEASQEVRGCRQFLSGGGTR